MENISLNGESILLKKDRTYFVIDGIYMNDIKNNLFEIDEHHLEEGIREKIFAFPKTDTPFILLNTCKEGDANGLIVFPIISIKKADENDDKKTCFSVDSGLLIFIEVGLFYKFLTDFEYDKLVDSPTQPINAEYWDFLYGKVDKNKIALVLAPGIGSGYDFIGSGTYKIV